MKQPTGWMKGEQWTLSFLTSAWLFTVSHAILISKLKRGELDEGTEMLEE